MSYFDEQLSNSCKDFIVKNSGVWDDLCSKIQVLSNCTTEITDSKQFLINLKQILQTKSLPDVDLLLKFLVPLYLSISNKNAAKKVLSSYFQGLTTSLQETAQELLCEKVQESCQEATVKMKDSTCEVTATNGRHVVDMLAALMDNFALGEACITNQSSTVIEFLAAAQHHFFHLFRQGGQSAMQTNMVMHDCHVTMQALNRLTQRHLPRDSQHLQHLTQQSVIANIMQKDIEMICDEQMMLDCRCCCAINLVLLLQISAPHVVFHVVKRWLQLDTSVLSVPPWLESVGLQLSLSSLTPLTSLAFLWGMLSMLESTTITMTMQSPDRILEEMDSSRTKKATSIAGKTDFRSTSEIHDSVSAKEQNDGSATDCSRNSVAASVHERIDVVQSMGDTIDASVSVAADCEKTFLFFETVLEKLLVLDERCKSTASRVQCIKTVTLWTTRMMSCVKESTLPPGVTERLRGEGPCLQRLLTFVWTHWQDQLDAIRQNSRIIFNNCLKVHVLACRCEDVSVNPFLLSLVHQVLDMGWGNVSKFSALTSLVPWVGTTPVLSSFPGFPSTLLAQVAEQAMACHASELYDVLIGQDKQKGGDIEEGDQTGWLTLWVNPIITNLCSANTKLKQHIIEYVLPKVVKKDRLVLEYMLKKLSSSKETDTAQLGALIVCLRRGRAWGLLPEALRTDDNSAVIWTKIYCALSSPEEQVRLDAFALLCESKRTAEAIGKVEFDHVRHFITYNLNNQSPAFRQAMLSFVKKLLFRINESQLALLRQKKKRQKESECTTALHNYSSFLSWLEGFLFSQLYPSAAFARRTMSLAILSLLITDVHTDKDGQGYKPMGNVTTSHMHTLLECLTDTFDENKQEAFKLLVFCTACHPTLLTEDQCRALYKSAMQLAVSTRPQDCGTAAYIFRFLLQQPAIVGIMSSHMHPPSASPVNEGLACGEGLQATSREPRSQTEGMVELEKLMEGLKATDGEVTSAVLRLLQRLLRLLMDQVMVAETSLILAAAQRPMYPTLHCIRCILHTVAFGCFEEKERPQWKAFCSCLLQACLQVARVVSPVVQNSSPEGNVPEEAVLGPGLKFDLGLMAEVEQSRQTVSLMPEYLVVCCWRSIKEVSLLLGQVCLTIPITQPGQCEGLFSFPQVEEIGRYFKQQLMESLHRGAFELAYAGFVMMCQMLWKSRWRDLQSLPQRWLEEVMSAIVSSEESSTLCSTRRSAGLPFFIQAIVATETVSSGRPSFHLAMRQLLNIALSSTAACQDVNTDGQVHAQNILRAMYKDSRLGEDVAPYICDGLKAAILGFKSQFWEVRNSATLLLSALMTRIFGVKRSKDESVLSKRNSQTGRAFFHKYPDLYQFLLKELEMATENLGSSGHLHLHPSLYPVLMVLGRLFPSTMEGSTTCLNLAAFIPYVIRCSSSPVYKTRMMAAKALQPLVGRGHLTAVLTTLLTTLSQQYQSSAGRHCHSHIHGVLLQIYHLVSLTGEMSGPLLQALVSVSVSGCLPFLWLITRDNPCLSTRAVGLEVIDVVLSSTEPILGSLSVSDQQNFHSMKKGLMEVLHAEVWAPPSPPYSPHSPFLSQLLSCVARLSMKYVCNDGGQDLVLRLLDFPVYEVHLAVLDGFLGCCAEGKDEETGQWSDPNCQSAVCPAGTERKDHGDDIAGEGRTFNRPGLSVAMVDRLLVMGLEDGAHPETVVKIFQLLASPGATGSVRPDHLCCEVFDKLLLKLKNERRADVKATLIQFSGSFIPGMCTEVKKKGEEWRQRVENSIRDWSILLKACCDTEQPEDLHLSCALVLRDNCEYLLVDRDGCLGSLVCEFWSLLVTLLQADDLEVKDIAASVSARLSGNGGSHPEQALCQLTYSMLCLHYHRRPEDCLTAVFSWITPLPANFDEETKGLFDKGELNTFQDGITLARVVSQTLAWFLKQMPDGGSKENPTHNPYHQPLVLDSVKSLLQENLLKRHKPHPSLPALPRDTDCPQLAQIVRQIADMMTTQSDDVSTSDNDSLESMFIRGSLYCDQTAVMIQLAMVVHSLKGLEHLMPSSGNVQQMMKEIINCCRRKVNEHQSCNVVLQIVVSSL